MFKFSLIFSFLLISLILFQGCNTPEQNDPVTSHQNDKQHVTGIINNAAGKTIKLVAFDGEKWNPLSAYEIKKDGSFILTAPNELLYCQLLIDNANGIPIPLAGNDSVYIESSFPNLSENFTASNISYASTLNSYIHMMHEFITSQQSTITLIQQQDPNDTSSVNGLVRKILLAKQPIDDLAIEYVNANPSSPLNQVLSAQFYPNNGFQFWNPTYMNHLDLILNAYKKEYPNAYYTKSLEIQLNSWKGSYEQYQKHLQRLAFYGDLNKPVEIGNKAPDILLENPEGKEIKLSSLKGQYVLIDFWASWCGPCRRENPNVVRLYHQYKDKGFTVYSVSLDDNLEQWKAAIINDQLAWPHHVSDLMKWNSLVVQLYKFNGIPHTVLLDKNGVIIAKNLRGLELEQKLQELLGK